MRGTRISTQKNAMTHGAVANALGTFCIVGLVSHCAMRHGISLVEICVPRIEIRICKKIWAESEEM